MRSSAGPQTASQTLVFPRRVVQAGVGVTGYSATFENRRDRSLGRLTVRARWQLECSAPAVAWAADALAPRPFAQHTDHGPGLLLLLK